MNLRQRLRKDKICCRPWKHYKGEIKNLPISSQCLFSNNGIQWDIVEIELKEEGWLEQEESLWEVIAEPNGLKRKLNFNISSEPFKDTWSDKDYIEYYKAIEERKNIYSKNKSIIKI